MRSYSTESWTKWGYSFLPRDTYDSRAYYATSINVISIYKSTQQSDSNKKAAKKVDGKKFSNNTPNRQAHPLPKHDRNMLNAQWHVRCEWCIFVMRMKRHKFELLEKQRQTAGAGEKRNSTSTTILFDFRSHCRSSRSLCRFSVPKCCARLVRYKHNEYKEEQKKKKRFFRRVYSHWESFEGEQQGNRMFQGYCTCTWNTSNFCFSFLLALMSLATNSSPRPNRAHIRYITQIFGSASWIHILFSVFFRAGARAIWRVWSAEGQQ